MLNITHRYNNKNFTKSTYIFSDTYQSHLKQHIKEHEKAYETEVINEFTDTNYQTLCIL